jgi:hypothetical protein
MFRIILCRMSRGRRASGGASSSVVPAFKSNFDPSNLAHAAAWTPRRELVAVPSQSRCRRRHACTSHRVPHATHGTQRTSRRSPLAARHSPLTLLLVSSPSLAVAVADKALGRFLAEAVESGAPDVALAPLAPLAEAVGSLDVDGDGLISVEELLERAAEEGVTLSREEAEKFVQICDELGSEGMDGLCDVDVRAAWFPQRWCLFVLPPAGARSHPALSLVRSLVRSLDRQEYLMSLSTVVYGSYGCVVPCELYFDLVTHLQCKWECS